MQIELPKADSPKRKRHWFQFSLRALLIAVTVLAMPLSYVAWQARIVRQREVILEQIKNRGGRFWTVEFIRETVKYDRVVKNTNWPEPTIPLLRRWLGDEAIVWIGLPPNEPLWDECHAAFPEAVIQRISAVPHD